MDPETERGPDTEDPRWEGWPCHGRHTRIPDCVTHSNQYGVLKECARCALPIQYTGRVGYSGYYRAKRAHPNIVREAQNWLQRQPDPCTNTKMKAKIREIVERNKQNARPNRQERRATGQEEEQPPEPEYPEEDSELDPEVCHICGAEATDDNEQMACNVCHKMTCLSHLRTGTCPQCRPKGPPRGG